jgi:hypothetical protein
MLAIASATQNRNLSNRFLRRRRAVRTCASCSIDPARIHDTGRQGGRQAPSLFFTGPRLSAPAEAAADADNDGAGLCRMDGDLRRAAGRAVPPRLLTCLAGWRSANLIGSPHSCCSSRHVRSMGVPHLRLHSWSCRLQKASVEASSWKSCSRVGSDNTLI